MRALVACLALSALAPGAARAVPSAARSTIPAHAVLVGSSLGLADTTTGAFTIVARDAADNPVPDIVIEFRAINCPEARIAVDQLQPGVGARCATNAVTAVTGPDGAVRMAVVGAGDPAAPHGSGPCAQVFAAGLPLGTVRLAYLDLDGSAGLGSNDLSVWLGDFGTGESIARSDFDGDDVVGAEDLSLWLTAWAAGRETESSGSWCSGFVASP